MDVVELARTERVSPIVIVPKNGGTLRFLVEYHKLTAIMILDSYPIPRNRK